MKKKSKHGPRMGLGVKKQALTQVQRGKRTGKIKTEEIEGGKKKDLPLRGKGGAWFSKEKAVLKTNKRKKN